MDNKYSNFTILFTIIIAFSVVFFLNFGSAASCWSYNSSSGGCNVTNGCIYKNDSWGSWCEELNCWSFYTQDGCNDADISGKNCSWSAGGTNYFCEEPSCYGYAGTNESACVNNTAGKSCSWVSNCYSVGWTPGGVSCWDIAVEATCLNTTGCNWGECQTRGCYDYTTSASCNASIDPWNARNCTWDSSGSGWCKTDSCSDSVLYNNKTLCNGASHCIWSGSQTTGRCEEIGCWFFDGNQTGCTGSNNTNGIDCKWNSGYCVEDNCWSYDSDETGCGEKAQCEWTAWESSGWCEEVNCWTWDSSHGGSEDACASNASLYGLNCNWQNYSGGGGGWCEKDYSSTNCSSYTTERNCYDSWYCWWQANDWSDPSKGGNCTDPDWSTVDDTGTILNNWNPGCYIFDNNQTECGYILGCDNSTANSCDTNSTHANSEPITFDGINCTMINDSSLCNNMAALSTCCAWQSGVCTKQEFDASCWNDLAQTQGGETSCEDASSKTNCDALAGSPWYWPCKWVNATKTCTVKTDDVWGNGTKSYVSIENKKVCEAVGGRWITDNYCVGNVSVPTGRCEYKFDYESNCDKACFACEFKSINQDTGQKTAHNDSDTARNACGASKLGYCEYTADASAPNGFGKCRPKKEFIGGVSEGCSATNCGGCTFLGVGNSSLAGNGTRTAEQHCNDFRDSCKWVDDATATTGGYCVDIETETCKEVCDRCDTQEKCTGDGRSAITNVSGSCKWQGDDNNGNCVANVAGAVEICWNGVDDDTDGLTDCADPGCYSDSFCGLVEGDCLIWKNSTDCASDANCEWITDKWGSWCDFRGSHCWLNDGNANKCRGITDKNETLDITAARLVANNINETYNFSLANLGYGWVSGTVNFTNGTGTSLEGNYTVDYIAQTVNFTNTTFMVSGGGAFSNITNASYQYNASSGQYCEWQAGTGGGWCEQDWSIAEECFLGVNETDCATVTASDGQTCTWTNDTWCDSQNVGNEWCDNTGGWCDHPSFAFQDCWQYNDNSSCSVTSGCNWKTDIWSEPHCEVNWSMGCWGLFDNSSCAATNGCYWNNESWGGWCGETLGKCWSYSSQTACNGAAQDCTWESYGGGGGTCQPSCYNETLYDSSSACGGVSGCVWKEETGWCEEQQSQACYNSTNYNDQSECDGTSGCKWRSGGWCNPIDGFNTGGGGGHGGSGGECYKQDGNKTACTNKTIAGSSCNWFAETSPWCEVDWSADCWSYTSIAGGCNVTNGCWFKDDEWGTYCTNLAEQCWQNTSLHNNAAECNSNAYCNATSWGTCEPTCFSSPSQSACEANTGCKWLSGWCNPTGMIEVFDSMEAGAPTPLGIDPCGPLSGEGITQQSVDMCGFGMKDMSDAYGFGANVFNFENASVCNKVKLSTYVTGGFGGGEFGGVGGSEKTGDGNETVRFIVYLDSDGATTGGCRIESNSSTKGYEFKFRYSSVWSGNESKAVETFTSYKCENSKWATTDVKISAWKQKMCGELGGPMIAVEKAELARFPTLYSSSADLRIAVLTIGNDNSSRVYNVTSPTDVAGPAWATPGAIDFEIGGAMEWGANAAKFGSALQHGFVKYEDCYNGVDDDEDLAVDCSDWDCEFSSACTSKGVNAAGYNDTTMPKLKGLKLEEYPDSAKIMFETSKPVNSTLRFYRNDSQCLTVNKTLLDIGIRSSNVRTYKMWHEIDIYNDAGVTSLSYDLANDTKYYYKLNICDSVGRCSLSKCSSFVTSNTNKCGFCNFVLRMKEPSSWGIFYDADQNEVYEHEQGAVCGANSGMKMNYTDGRGINVKLNKDDGTVYFEFMNASVTKTALNDKVRTLTTNDDSIIGTSTLVGLNANTRDKIINNLHPEICRVKIPSSGTCDTLEHCDDDGNNCVDRTSESVLLDATNCVWQVPFCEFSTYKEAADAGSGSSSSSSSSGGGGGGSSTTVVCGDGIRAGSEECDDGNTVNGDGCSSTCKDEIDDDGSVDSGTGEVGDGPSSGDSVKKDSDKAGDLRGTIKDASKGFFWVVVGLILVAGIVGALRFVGKNYKFHVMFWKRRVDTWLLIFTGFSILVGSATVIKNL
jgi:hypothetical protein